MLQVWDQVPPSHSLYSPVPLSCTLVLLLHVDNLFNGAIKSNLHSWLEDILVPHPGTPSGMELKFVFSGLSPRSVPEGAYLSPFTLSSLYGLSLTQM